jgi:hypothetical protein
MTALSRRQVLQSLLAMMGTPSILESSAQLERTVPAGSMLARSLEVLAPHCEPAHIRAMGYALSGSERRHLTAPRRRTILGLEEFASLTGASVGSAEIEDPNHLPFDLSDTSAIEAYGEDMERFLQSGVLSPTAESLRTALLAEVQEPIPEMEVTAEHPALAGFPIGSRVPWCGREGRRFVQHYLEGFRADGRFEVLARSRVNQKPLIVADRGGKLLAYDLLSLTEPSLRWEDRGGFNKYQPLLSFCGHPPLAGRYRNAKPDYASFAASVRAVAGRFPDWRLDTVGERGADLIYALTLGDATKPLYVIAAMLHAEDEWVPSLGTLALIEYLGEHWRRPAWRRFFQRFAVKVFPLQQPAVYESPRFHPKADRPRDRLNRAMLERDVVYAIMQLHQGGQGFVTACGTPRELGERMVRAAQPRRRGLLWRDGKPELFDARLNVAVAPPSWDLAYYIHPYYRLYPDAQQMGARVMLYAEFPMIGFMPERFIASQHHHASHRSFFVAPTHYTLAQTEQVVNWCLAFLETPADGLERPRDWQPPMG